MKWLEHIEALILIFAPIAGMIALVSEFSWSNLIMFSILMLVWKIGNGAL